MNAPDRGQLQPFAYRGWTFSCAARPDGRGMFLPEVMCIGTASGRQTELPRDTEAYATEAEALRQAEQQAIRWVQEHEDTRGQE